jgi:spermidine/putrescine transport system ATP-binding protein
VAEFVGTNNILSGQVQQVGPERVIVATPLGQFTAAAQAGRARQVGDAVEYVVSADNILLSGAGAAEANTLRGSLISEQFIGSTVTLHVEVDGGAEFRIQKQQRELDRLDLAPGGPVIMSWTPESAYLLAAA